VWVTAGTPAATADLAPGDVIVSLGGHAVTSAASLRSALDACENYVPTGICQFGVILTE